MTRRTVEVPAADLRGGDRLVRIGTQTDWGIHTWVLTREGEALEPGEATATSGQARLDELRAAWQEATGDDPADYALSDDDWALGLDAAEIDELHALEAELNAAGRFPAMRVRRARDGRLGTVPRGTVPQAGPMGGTMWPVRWDDGTTTVEDDDELEVAP